MKHKRDDGPEKQEDEAVDVTPVMICVFVVMCCSMLVLLYFFYDQLGGSPASALRAVCVGGGGCGPCLQGVPGWGGCPSLSLVRAHLPGEVQSPPSAPHCPPPRNSPPVYVIIGIFCLASSTGLYSCLSPLVQRLPFCKCR